VWLAGPSGRARLARISNTVVRIDIDGHAYGEFAEPMQERLDWLLSHHGRVFVALDAEAMASYDGRFRYQLTEWIKRNHSAIDGMIMLVRHESAKVAAVVINAVNDADVIDSCTDRDEFEDLLYEAVLRCRSRDAKSSEPS
jgi:hypothetical protein